MGSIGIECRVITCGEDMVEPEISQGRQWRNDIIIYV